MKDNAMEKIKDLIDDIISDKKTLVKILSVMMILLLAAVLRIHSANTSQINVEAADTSETVSEEGATEESESYDSDDEDYRSVSDIVFVDIGGAVEEPGVYQVASGTRLFEVIEMAGGLTEKADTDSVNQAAVVEDGVKIIIPKKKKGGTSAAESSVAEQISSSYTASADGSQSSDLVNINTASKEELTRLNGIGDVIAERIIEYRKTNSFKNKEDIKSVKGIGNGIYNNIKDSITC